MKSKRDVVCGEGCGAGGVWTVEGRGEGCGDRRGVWSWRGVEVKGCGGRGLLRLELEGLGA